MSTSLHRPPVASPGVPSPRIPLPGRATDRRAFAARLLRGRDDDAAWVRPCLLGLLVATAMLYLWDLGASGWANAYYSAAAQAGSVSWKAFFYGASDAASSITVDKTPASLWVMALSVRLFGLSSWSILVPQALMGVAAVGVLYAAVRRWFPPAAGLLAGAAFALTPVATLMFRFNNPDALLTLLVLGAYAIIRAVERAGTGWLLLAAACVGFGFLTKMLQALLVVPAFAGVYLLAAPATLRRRVGQLAMAGLALIASAGWWVAIVDLVPASMRPDIGGSQTNSLLELTLGYNGLGRQAPDGRLPRAPRDGFPRGAPGADGGFAPGPAGGGGRGMGGLLNGSSPSAELVTLLSRRRAPTLGGRNRRRQQRGRLPAHRRRPRHGDRRLQRQRPRPGARAVPAVRPRRKDPLLHRRRRNAQRQRQQRLPGDRGLGGGQLHRHRGRRRHRLRPDHNHGDQLKADARTRRAPVHQPSRTTVAVPLRTARARWSWHAGWHGVSEGPPTLRVSPAAPPPPERPSDQETEMRKIIVTEWMSIDGVVQAPGAADEDTTGGFQHGGWHLRYVDDLSQ